MNAGGDERATGETIGLFAGQGVLPVLVARGMRAQGMRVHAVGLSGQYLPELRGECDRFRTVGILRLGQWVRALRRMGVREAVMVGGVNKSRTMHDPLRMVRNIPDWRTARLWYRRLRHDRRSPALLAAVAEELAAGGITLVDSTLHIKEHLATVGVMTRSAPVGEQLADIAFGWPLLTEALRLGIGQSIAVRERDVIAVEGIEGTDAMIKRAGELCRRRGWTLLKAAGAQHDRRADVPTIGETTVRTMAASGGACIAVAVGDVILVDKPGTLALADELGVAIVGVRPDGGIR